MAVTADGLPDPFGFNGFTPVRGHPGGGEFLFFGLPLPLLLQAFWPQPEDGQRER